MQVGEKGFLRWAEVGCEDVWNDVVFLYMIMVFWEFEFV